MKEINLRNVIITECYSHKYRNMVYLIAYIIELKHVVFKQNLYIRIHLCLTISTKNFLI